MSNTRRYVFTRNPFNLPVSTPHNVWTRNSFTLRLESNHWFIILPELNLLFQKFYANVLAYCFGSFSHDVVMRVI